MDMQEIKDMVTKVIEDGERVKRMFQESLPTPEKQQELYELAVKAAQSMEEFKARMELEQKALEILKPQSQ